MASRQLKLPVPVHIVTGALGSGKTTFLQVGCHLLLPPYSSCCSIVGWGVLASPGR